MLLVLLDVSGFGVKARTSNRTKTTGGLGMKLLRSSESPKLANLLSWLSWEMRQGSFEGLEEQGGNGKRK